MGDPLRAKETFARVVSEYGDAPQARRSELYLEYIAQRYGAEPRPQDAADRGRRPRPPLRRPWLTEPRPSATRRLRELVARGRAHYVARRVRRGDRAASRTCCARRPPTPTSTTCWASSITRRGAWPKPRRCSSEALRINPGYTEAALNLVVTCNDLGKYGEAKVVYEQAMATSKRAPRELDPFAKGKIANMHADVGAAYRAVGLYDEAVREYERALALCPTFVDIRTELGNTRREMGDVAGAIRELERVRAESPRFVGGRLQLGLGYYAAGRRDDAAGEWRAVLEIAPDNRSAQMYLALLDREGRRRALSARPRAHLHPRRPSASSSRRSPPTRRAARASTPSCGSRSAA